MDSEPQPKCGVTNISEFKENFKNPKLKKPTSTRAKLFEQYLWQELFEEYIRYNDRLNMPIDEKDNSEYYDEYCQRAAVTDEVAREELNNRFPLYCTCAITTYNHDGDMTKDFKKRYHITRPVYEQTEQFG